MLTENSSEISYKVLHLLSCLTCPSIPFSSF